MRTAPILVFLDYDLRETFDAICFSLGQTRSDIISLLLEDFIYQSGLAASDEMLDEAVTPAESARKN